MRTWVCLAILCAACGAANDDYPPVSAPMPAAATDDRRPPAGKLWRDEVDETVDSGLGRFLQRVDLEPSLIDGKFQGFRIVELRPADFWQDVDLRPGDVILRVNGMPIERETQAFDAFTALKKSPSLRVTVRRGGGERELVWQIVARPSAAPSAPARPSDGGKKTS